MHMHKWSRQNKDVAFEWKGMHMSDAISAAVCDLSEISCRWALRHGLFNSAGDCRVPNVSVTVSSCLRAGDTYLNKWTRASLVGNTSTVVYQEDFSSCPPVSTLETQQTCEFIPVWHKSFPRRVQPDRICITCDIHMMAQNWLVMPDLSGVAATKALWLHDGCSYSAPCCCCSGFGVNSGFIVVKAFTNCWSSYLIFASGGFQRVISLFCERKYLSSYYGNAGHVLCLWGQQKWESQWDYISLMKLLRPMLISWNSIRKLYFHFTVATQGVAIVR